MRRIFVGALFALVAIAAAGRAEAALIIKSRVNSGANPQQIRPFISVTSDSSSAVEINGMIIKYYFYESVLPAVFPDPTHSAGITVSVTRMPMTYTGESKNANHVVTIQITSSHMVDSGNPFNFNFTVVTNPLRNFDQTNDWSYLDNTSSNYLNNQNITLQATGSSLLWGTAPSNHRPTQIALARQKVKHIVVIMQENRSFDNYFGTFPGADGLANAPNGPEDRRSSCNNQIYNPAPITHTVNASGQPQRLWDLPHGMAEAKVGLGCPTTPTESKVCGATGPLKIRDALLATTNKYGCAIDLPLKQTVGYYDGSVPSAPIYNYWTLAKNFMLQDRMFSAVPSWSRIQHLFMVSGWSAVCTSATNCTENYNNVPSPFHWNEVTGLLRNNNVTWGYYRGENWNPNCAACKTAPLSCFTKSTAILSFWNPLPEFTNVVAANQQGNVKPLQDFLAAVTSGSETAVPKVSWIVPAMALSEHDTNPGDYAPAPHNVGAGVDLKHGQAYVTMLVQQIMKQTPLWNSTVVFLAWDDWGGYYDHVRPPKDSDGLLMYGHRVPGLTISSWLRAAGSGPGTIDNTTYSPDAYLRFIEDVFAQSVRITGNNRPTPVRENRAALGNLLDEFDFNRVPLAAPPAVANLSCQAP